MKKNEDMIEKQSRAIFDSSIVASHSLLFFHNQFNTKEVLSVLESNRRRARHG
ncbi:hypothetical protein FKJ74_000629 [Enterococcus faecalis]|uniref:hypothetical protein n=1 Tax=Enterococcus TaxID=1350 RepID=UPI0012AD1C17|nr:hypothetical protein [Enterococcus faecalis]EGO2696615.1 hypothetical protein [Enterococcus faecalis]EGO2741935.1 hypothetical protein [Enterococcus faecalis]EGO2801718.1 hypothetical protein [Enterococcus faecalis]EGO2810982.1 hypothetical protein [Enterococcus faecalis]EGO2830276.1 hypothetical protein [Enterococcus faecalis]